MKVCNIKVSLYFDGDFFEKKRSNEKIIWKECQWTFIQYQHSPHLVNVTGIKSQDSIDEVISLLEKKFKKKCVKHQIDCAMISHKDYKKIRLSHVYDILGDITSDFYIDYQPELFTGLFLKPYKREFPTVNLFYTGSFQLLGGKSFDTINSTFIMVKKLIQSCENKKLIS